MTLSVLAQEIDKAEAGFGGGAEAYYASNNVGNDGNFSSQVLIQAIE